MFRRGFRFFSAAQIAQLRIDGFWPVGRHGENLRGPALSVGYIAYDTFCFYHLSYVPYFYFKKGGKNISGYRKAYLSVFAGMIPGKSKAKQRSNDFTDRINKFI